MLGWVSLYVTFKHCSETRLFGETIGPMLCIVLQSGSDCIIKSQIILLDIYTNQPLIFYIASSHKQIKRVAKAN